MSPFIGSLCEKKSKEDADYGAGPQNHTGEETPASPTAELASSPSNCQDPFCSHPYPPSPSPLPARTKAKRAKKAKKRSKIPKIEVKIEDLDNEEEEEVSMTRGE